MSDVYSNTAGAFLGAAAGVIALQGARRHARFERHPFSSLLLLIWFGNRLFPFVPALDAARYRVILKPLAAFWIVRPDDLFRSFANWLAVLILAEAVFGIPAARRAAPWLVAFTLAGRVVIASTPLTPAEVLGSALAAVLWTVVL